MKNLLALMFLYSVSSYAGGYYEPRINTYDPITGLYYKSVESTLDQGGFLSSKASSITNINIFDPAKGQSILLFKEPQKESIAVVLFETGFKDGVLEFNGSTYGSVVLNNTRIDKRDPKDKLLVGVRGKNELTLFVSSKRGNDIKKLVVVPTTADWHLDARNSKVRVVHQIGSTVRIESFEW